MVTFYLVHGECHRKHFLSYLPKYSGHLRRCQVSIVTAFTLVCSHSGAIYKICCLILIAFKTAVVEKVVLVVCSKER